MRREKAREYLLGRGLSEESLREFEVGFAPNRWDTIVMRGQQGGFAQGGVGRSGVGQEGTEGRVDGPLPRSDHVPDS